MSYRDPQAAVFGTHCHPAADVKSDRVEARFRGADAYPALDRTVADRSEPAFDHRVSTAIAAAAKLRIDDGFESCRVSPGADLKLAMLGQAELRLADEQQP